MPQCSIKGESCGFACTGYDGGAQWKKMHAAAEEIGCESCRIHGKALVSGLHDHVNAGLGKKVYDKKNYEHFVHEVNCAYNRCKADGRC